MVFIGLCLAFYVGKAITLHPLFLLMREAQKKKLGKKKHAVFVELRAPPPRKRGFLKKAPFETEKHRQTPTPVFLTGVGVLGGEGDFF